MQITFSTEEFVAMLSSLWGVPLDAADLVLDFDEHTGEVKTFSLTGIDAKTLSKIGNVTQSVTPPKLPYWHSKPSTSHYDSLPDATSVKETDPTYTEEDPDELDEILRKSHELMLQGMPPKVESATPENDLLSYPGSSEEFPVEFANRSIGR